MAQPPWFEAVFGFQEMNFGWTQKRFKLEKENDEDVLHCVPSGKRFVIGHFECPSVSELQDRLQKETKCTPSNGKRLVFQNIAGDVGDLHKDSDNEGAVFQVASQFNCLEMMGPDRKPEHGIAIYAHDHTQGPTCAMCCPAALAFRNYLVNGVGQAKGRQLDLLSGVAELLENGRYGYWDMKNGYCLPQADDSLGRLANKLENCKQLPEQVKSSLRVGIHWSTSVIGQTHQVCQIYCSGLPVAYAPHTHADDWRAFACAVLDGAYEATLAAAALLARQRGSRVKVYLTAIGGGVFGNLVEWIVAAMEKALNVCSDAPLDVFLVHYKVLPTEGVFCDLADRWKPKADRMSKKRPAHAPAVGDRQRNPKKRPAAQGK